ncbi:MAG: hypothetical protein GX616_10390 [Planctomycetes bacterium]|nr:hypothetical protein [Planctomycetota bacterium]
MSQSKFPGLLTGLLAAVAVLLVRPLQAAELTNEALWQEAQQLEQSEKYDQAADRYRAILSSETRWKKRAKAALLAANCLDHIGRSTESIPLLDKAIAEADTLLAQNKPGIDESWTLSALYGKAVACEKTGDRAGALKAIERIRAQFFKSDEAREALAIQARLEGWSPQRLTQILAREQEAIQMAEQAAEASKQNRDQEAVDLSDRIIQQYPDTAAVYPAMRTKALSLWRLHKYHSAKVVYNDILQRVEPIAPHSQLVRTAQRRVAWLDATSLFKRLMEQRIRGDSVSDGDWQRVRDLCATVTDLTSDPHERAQVRTIAIESLYWKGDAKATIAAAEQFLKEYAGDKKYRLFKREVAAVQFMLADKLREIGQYQEALAHYRWLIQACEGSDPIDLGAELLSRLYYRIWWTLGSTGASEAERSSVEQALISTSPHSTYVQCIQVIKQQEEDRDAR